MNANQFQKAGLLLAILCVALFSEAATTGKGFNPKNWDCRKILSNLGAKEDNAYFQLSTLMYQRDSVEWELTQLRNHAPSSQPNELTVKFPFFMMIKNNLGLLKNPNLASWSEEYELNTENTSRIAIRESDVRRSVAAGHLVRELTEIKKVMMTIPEENRGPEFRPLKKMIETKIKALKKVEDLFLAEAKTRDGEHAHEAKRISRRNRWFKELNGLDFRGMVRNVFDRASGHYEAFLADEKRIWDSMDSQIKDLDKRIEKTMNSISSLHSDETRHKQLDQLFSKAQPQLPFVVDSWNWGKPKTRSQNLTPVKSINIVPMADNDIELFMDDKNLNPQVLKTLIGRYVDIPSFPPVSGRLFGFRYSFEHESFVLDVFMPERHEWKSVSVHRRSGTTVNVLRKNEYNPLKNYVGKHVSLRRIQAEEPRMKWTYSHPIEGIVIENNEQHIIIDQGGQTLEIPVIESNTEWLRVVTQ